MSAHPHRHDPDHDHQHPHDHGDATVGQLPPESHNQGAGAGPVMIELGGGAGALVLHTGPDLLGAEVEISPADADTPRTHVAVLSRTVGAGQVNAAVYPTLAAGSWNLWDPRTGARALTVTIEDGQVTETHWPAG